MKKEDKDLLLRLYRLIEKKFIDLRAEHVEETDIPEEIAEEVKSILEKDSNGQLRRTVKAVFKISLRQGGPKEAISMVKRAFQFTGSILTGISEKYKDKFIEKIKKQIRKAEPDLDGHRLQSHCETIWLQLMTQAMKMVKSTDPDEIEKIIRRLCQDAEVRVVKKFEAHGYDRVITRTNDVKNSDFRPRLKYLDN